jgi:hypothetical protein
VSRRLSAAAVGAIGVALVILGLGAWALSRLIAGNESHSYARGEPPYSVQVTARQHYAIAVRGGVRTELQAGLEPTALTCSASSPRLGSISLAVQAEKADTKAINQIGTFVAPISAALHVDCAGLGTVFVDDAADASTDWAGVAVLLATVLLGLGAPLGLSAVRRSVGRSRDDEQVERPVDVVG